MEYTNYTPFPTLCFDTLWPDNRDHFTIVIKATANIIPDNLLELAEEQLPLQVTDEYYGQPGTSALKYPHDLSPFKPKADIILNATAYITNKRGSITSLKVGNLVKKLIVIGPRFWNKSFPGWRLTKTEPTPKQPIRYEFAFGGTAQYTDEKGESRIIDVNQKNPVGRGWHSPVAKKMGSNVKLY